MLFTRQKKVRQKLKKLVFALIGIYVLLGTMLYFFQEQILFRPTKLSQDFKFEFAYPFEELFLKTEDEATINALHFKVENPKGVILYFHGNAGDLSRWGKVTEFFVEKQYDVLVMDYRTYGKSKGKLNESLLYNDAQMCYDYLKKNYKEERISVYGRSLGATFATYIASNNNPIQLILESPFYNVLDVAKHRFPYFPLDRLIKYKLKSNEMIAKVTCPISIFHGTLDMVVPFTSGEKLYSVSPKANTTFTILEEANHNDIFDFELYHSRIRNILP